MLRDIRHHTNHPKHFPLWVEEGEPVLLQPNHAAVSPNDAVSNVGRRILGRKVFNCGDKFWAIVWVDFG
jgi:hypothetical protein